MAQWLEKHCRRPSLMPCGDKSKRKRCGQRLRHNAYMSTLKHFKVQCHVALDHLNIIYNLPNQKQGTNLVFKPVWTTLEGSGWSTLQRGGGVSFSHGVQTVNGKLDRSWTGRALKREHHEESPLAFIHYFFTSGQSDITWTPW